MKMQTFKAIIKDSFPQITQITQILLVFLLIGCGETAVFSPTPTPIPTETAVLLPTAVNNTPTISPSKTPEPTPIATQTPVSTVTPLPEGQSIGDPYAPELGNMGYDVTHYNLLMALDPAVTNIDATVIIEGVVTSPT
ncbi:MAG: M1 family metallopeptidase, partial [Chloroflexi bacterium]|nr:M1 family metallopeptidase [Chloroflexota bacterium]